MVAGSGSSSSSPERDKFLTEALITATALMKTLAEKRFNHFFLSLSLCVYRVTVPDTPTASPSSWSAPGRAERWKFPPPSPPSASTTKESECKRALSLTPTNSSWRKQDGWTLLTLTKRSTRTRRAPATAPRSEQPRLSLTTLNCSTVWFIAVCPLRPGGMRTKILHHHTQRVISYLSRWKERGENLRYRILSSNKLASHQGRYLKKTKQKKKKPIKAKTETVCSEQMKHLWVRLWVTSQCPD